VNASVAKGLVPPRPNLGPEPWPTGPPLGAMFVTAAVGLALMIALLFARRLGKRRPGPREGGVPTLPAEVNPRDQMVALSAAIRQALTEKLGTAWRAKTTEEVAIDPLLENLLGREDLDELSRFLDRVDRLKFAPERSNHQDETIQGQLAQWQPRVAEITAKIQAHVQNALDQGPKSPLWKRTPTMSVR
jgi:hypothetical protein